MLKLDDFSFIFIAINLLVLFLILRKVLFKRVTDILDKRAQYIRDTIASAESRENDAAEMKKQYQTQLSKAESEAEVIFQGLIAESERKSQEILSQAKQNAEEIIRKALTEIESERNKMLREIKNQAAGLALAAAAKVVEANMDNEMNRQLINSFLNEEGVA